MAAKPNTIEMLETSLNMVDCLSQEAFDQIEMICNVYLTAMLVPEFWNSSDDVATALVAIKQRAADARNAINCEAEDHGCNWIDEKGRARYAARYAARRLAVEVTHG